MVRFLAFSCMHAPCTDQGYFKWLCRQIKEFKPHWVINLGDWYEGLDAKKWERYVDEDWDTMEEHVEVQRQSDEIVAAAPGARRVFMWGNHESNLFGRQPGRIPQGLSRLIHYKRHTSIADDWRIIDRYEDDVKFRLGPVTFQHGCSFGAKAEVDAAYHFGVPYGLYVCGHTHRLKPVTQCQERQVLMPYWYANPGTGMDFKRANYMKRKRVSRWGSGCIVGETAGATQRRTAFAQKNWSAELRVYSLADERFLA